MADRNFEEELDALGDETTEIDPVMTGLTAPVGVSETAREVEPVVQSLGLRHSIDRATAEAEATTKSRGHRGLLGDSFGIMDESERNTWFDEFKADLESTRQQQNQNEQIAERGKAFWGRIIGEDAAEALSTTKVFGLAGTASGQDVDKANRKEIAKSQKRVSAIDEGRAETATKTPFRAGVENVATGLAGIGSGIIKGVGIGAGYAGSAVGFDVGPDENITYSLGKWVDAKARQMFPGDVARQEEFSQKLAQGAGSMLGFYGPAILGKLAGASERVLIGITAASGALTEGSETFEQATESRRHGREVTEGRRFLAYMGGLLLGTSEAAPVADFLKGGKSGILRTLNRQGAEEAIQEGGQTLGENMLAHLLHDPDREIFKDVGENAAIGYILGAFMQGAQIAASKQARADARRGTEEGPPAARTPSDDERPGRETTFDLDPYAPIAEPTEPEGEFPADEGPLAPLVPDVSGQEEGGELAASELEEAAVAEPQEIVEPETPVEAPVAAPVIEPEAAGPLRPSYEIGVPQAIVTPDGSMEVEAVPEIIDLADLRLASGDLQPRDRSRAESEAGVRQRAATLDPGRLLPGRVSDAGAPIVTQDGVVLSGNGRVMSIAEVYRDPALKRRADAYRAALGPAAAGMREPVLVSRLAQPLSREDLIRFADLSNRPATAGMSATERAMRDVRAAGAEIMRLYAGGSFTAPQNREFFRAFTGQAITEAERGTISRNGLLTKEGEDRMSAAVLAAAYGDPDLLARMLESTDDNIRNVTGSLRDAAGSFIRLKDAIRRGEADGRFDITPEIVETARRIADLRDRNIKPATFLAQQDAFTQVDPVVEALLRAFYNDNLSRALSREKLTELLTAYAEEAQKHQANGLIPDETTPQDVIAYGRRAAFRDERLGASQGDIFASGTASTARGTDAGTGGEARGRGSASSGQGARGGRSRGAVEDELAASMVPRQGTSRLGTGLTELSQRDFRAAEAVDRVRGAAQPAIAEPSFAEVSALIPKDAGGDPDFPKLAARIQAEYGKMGWRNLTSDEKAELFQALGGQLQAVEAPASHTEAPASIEAQSPQEATEAAPEPTEGQETAISNEQRLAFREILAGKAPRRQWEQLLSVNPDQMQALIDEAAEGGLVRVDRNGVVRRTALAKQSVPAVDPTTPEVGSPEDLIQREAAARAVMESPEWQSAILVDPSRDTSKVDGFLSDEWKASRRYAKDGREIGDWNAAVDFLFDEAHAAVPGGVANERKLFVVMGFPGAGKSTIINAIRADKRAAHIVADDAKVIIPEYDGGRNSGGVHEESSAFATELTFRALATGGNTIIEKLGSSEQSVTRWIAAAKRAGYSVTMVNVEVPKAIAMERAVARYGRTGRAVPLPMYDLRITDLYEIIRSQGVTDDHTTIQWQEPAGWRITEPGSELSRLSLATDQRVRRQPRSGAVLEDGRRGEDVGRRPAVGGQAQGPVARLSIPPEIRLARAIETRERITGKPVNSIVLDYAGRIEDARGTDAFPPIMEEIRADKLFLKADAHDLAALVGIPVAKSTTKKAALETVEKRHEGLAAGRRQATSDLAMLSIASVAETVPADAEVGRSMRRDLDALGFFSQALEAARNLKQAKGTPEQMRAQLKAAGVKDAEIAATGLDRLLASTPEDAIGAVPQKRRAEIAEILSACRS